MKHFKSLFAVIFLIAVFLFSGSSIKAVSLNDFLISAVSQIRILLSASGHAPNVSFSCSTPDCIKYIGGSDLLFLDQTTDSSNDISIAQWFLKGEGESTWRSKYTCQPGESKYPLCNYGVPWNYGKGRYVVRLYVVDKEGNENSAEKIFEVKDKPANIAPSASFSCNPANCIATKGVNQKIDFTNTSTDPNGQPDIANSVWCFRPGEGPNGTCAVEKDCIKTDGKPICDNFIYATWPGKYNMRLTITDKQGSQGVVVRNFEIKSQTQNSAPVAKFSCSTTNCVGTLNKTDLVFKNQSTDPDGQNDIALATWMTKKEGDTKWASTYTCYANELCNLNPNSAQAGKFIVQLSVKDKTGKESLSEQKPYEIIPEFKIDISLATLKETYNKGDAVKLTDPPDETNDLPKLTSAQIAELARLNQAKIDAQKRAESAKATGRPVPQGMPTPTDTQVNLDNALRKYGVPESVQAQLDSINSQNLGWTANYNEFLFKSEEEKKKMMGINLTATQLNELEKKTESLKIQAPSVQAGGSVLPDFFDWRSQHGQNYVTSVKNQAGCGSCWAFSATGALEGAINAYYNNPKSSPDLSEQDILSCSGAGTCSGGWPFDALQYVKKGGIAEENCFPYSAKNEKCDKKCSDWQSKKWIIDNVSKVTLDDKRVENIKTALMKNGPLSIAFVVYYDFYSYTSGIYSADPSTGTAGGHAVTLVGFGKNDGRDYWICKNSWGTSFGENGYFRIYAGEASIDSWTVDYPIFPKGPEDQKVICEDKDKDNYCAWGTGLKPKIGCPECNASINDCDDSNKDIYSGCGESSQKIGALYLTSFPDKANIYVKDLSSGLFVKRGTTPLLTSLNVENRSFKISALGYKDAYRDVLIQEGQQANLNVSLEKDPQYDAIKITNNGKNIILGYSVDGNRIVWIEINTVEQKAILYYYDLLTNIKKQIASSAVPSSAFTYLDPVISGGKIAWVDYRNKQPNIYIYDLDKQEERQITAGNYNYGFLAISGNNIAFSREKAGNTTYNDIFVYNIDKNLLNQVTNSDTEKWGLDIYGDKIVWDEISGRDYGDFYLYDLAKKEESRLTNSKNYRCLPKIYENKIVWCGNQFGSGKVYLYDLVEKKELSLGEFGPERANPSIYGDKIAWRSNKDSEAGEYNIFLYDIKTKTETQITKNKKTSYSPKISGSLIVWRDYRENVTYGDIFAKKITNIPEPVVKCGNNKKDGTEECDGKDSSACPDRCSESCKCLPQSKIVNNGDSDIKGKLTMVLEKIGGVKTFVFNGVEITIPKKGLVKLDVGKDNTGKIVFGGWNGNAKAIAGEAGDYKVSAVFEAYGKKAESNWTFKVINGEKGIAPQVKSRNFLSSVMQTFTQIIKLVFWK